MPTRRQLLRLAATGPLLAVAQREPSAQGRTDGPVRLLVGFAAGGNFDVVARTLAPALAARLQRPVLVENRAGASGSIAAEQCARAAADGHTLLLAGAANAINASLHDGLAFDFVRDLAPVAGVVRFANVMAVAADLPVRSVPDFVAHARSQAGRIDHGSSGNGTTQHLAGELFKRMAGVEFAHVPYRGAAPAIAGLLGGQVQVLFEPLPATLPHIRAGKLRALAVTTDVRQAALPDVPALREFLEGYEASGWTGVCAPAGTPERMMETLHEATGAALQDPAIAARFDAMGATPMTGTRQSFAAFVAAEVAKWRDVIRAGNIKATQGAPPALLSRSPPAERSGGLRS